MGRAGSSSKTSERGISQRLLHNSTEHQQSILEEYFSLIDLQGFPGVSVVKNPPANVRAAGDKVQSLGQKDALEEKWQLIPMFLPAQSHGLWEDYRGAWRATTEQLSTQSHGLKAKWGSSASDFNFTLSTISLNSCGLHPHLSESFQPGSIHCLQLHQPGFTGSHNTSTHVKYLGI